MYGGGGFEKAKPNLKYQISKMCASCSGQNQHIIKMFKLACISYQSQRVPYRDLTLDRETVMIVQQGICR